jgi:translation initiation factor 6
VALIHPDLDK